MNQSSSFNPIISSSPLESSLPPEIDDFENDVFFDIDQDDDLIPDDDDFDFSDDTSDSDNVDQYLTPDNPSGLIAKLHQVITSKSPQLFVFNNHNSSMIEVQTAKTALSIYDQLNSDNQRIFEYIGSISPDSLAMITQVNHQGSATNETNH